MGSRFETIVLTDEDFGEDLWCAVAETVKILMRADYTCQISLELDGIVRIDYNYDSENDFGNATPCWLYPEESEVLEEVIDSILEECND